VWQLCQIVPQAVLYCSFFFFCLSLARMLVVPCCRTGIVYVSFFQSVLTSAVAGFCTQEFHLADQGIRTEHQLRPPVHRLQPLLLRHRPLRQTAKGTHRRASTAAASIAIARITYAAPLLPWQVLLLHVFAFLSPQDLRRAAQVSKKWRKLILGLSENYAAVAPAPASPSASAVADDFSTLARGSVSPLDVHANMLITPRTFTLVRFFPPLLCGILFLCSGCIPHRSF
jgi:hypothetical protein